MPRTGGLTTWAARAALLVGRPRRGPVLAVAPGLGGLAGGACFGRRDVVAAAGIAAAAGVLPLPAQRSRPAAARLQPAPRWSGAPASASAAAVRARGARHGRSSAVAGRPAAPASGRRGTRHAAPAPAARSVRHAPAAGALGGTGGGRRYSHGDVAAVAAAVAAAASGDAPTAGRGHAGDRRRCAVAVRYSPGQRARAGRPACGGRRQSPRGWRPPVLAVGQHGGARPEHGHDQEHQGAGHRDLARSPSWPARRATTASIRLSRCCVPREQQPGHERAHRRDHEEVEQRAGTRRRARPAADRPR